MPYQRVLFTYDENNRLSLELWQDWENTEWIDIRKWIISYDDMGNIKEVIWQFPLYRGDPLQNEMRDVFTYDQNNDNVQFLTQLWDYLDSSWQNLELQTYTYNDNHKFTEELVQNWNTTDTTWENSSLYYQQYNEYNNYTTELGYSWNVFDEIWEISDRDSNAYDEYQNNTYYILEFVGGTGWEKLFDITLTWTQVVTGLDNNGNISPIEYNLAQNYPNPFNPTTTINYSVPLAGLVTVKIYDVLGNDIKTLVNKEESAGDHSIQFNGSDLASGVYFYRMSAGNFINTKKFILMK